METIEQSLINQEGMYYEGCIAERSTARPQHAQSVLTTAFTPAVRSRFLRSMPLRSGSEKRSGSFQGKPASCGKQCEQQEQPEWQI